MKIIAADHVLPIASPPIERGAVLISGDKIGDVGGLENLRLRHPDVPVEDLGRAAILPGLVNTHSHLELTPLRGALDSVEHDFRTWLLRLNALRAELSDKDIAEGAYLGALEGARAGITCFGDVGRFGQAGYSALKRAGLRGIVFQETEFSPDVRTADADLKELLNKYQKLRKTETELVKTGISPHSPYTVSSRLFEAIAQYSIIEKVPLSIHTAESAAENTLLTSGEGFFIEVFEKFGLDWSSPMCSSVRYLERLGVLSARPLLVHCVTVSSNDIKSICDNGATIAHCPRSNAKFGHGIAPFGAFLDIDIPVGLGSDSVVSNNECDIIGEARFAALAARCLPENERFVSARDVLRAATLDGARALGLDKEIGSLEKGKQADITVVRLDMSAQQPVNDVEAAIIFSSNGRDVVRTIVAGKNVYSAPDSIIG